MRWYLTLFLVLAMVGRPTAASAQPISRAGQAGQARETLQAKVARLEAALAKVSRDRVDASSLLAMVQELQRQLIALRKKSAAEKQMTRGYKALRSQLDELEQKLGDLQLRLAALSVRDHDIASISYDRGFVMKKGRFKLRIRGFLQAEYRARVLSEERNLLDGEGRDQSGFLIGRARLGFAGHVFSERLRYQFVFELGDRARPNVLLDGLLAYRFHRLIELRAGLMRIPFGRQFALRVCGMQFDDRSQSTLAFYPGRDIGLMATGAFFDSRRFGALRYQIGVFNGANASDTSDNNLDLLYAARLVYEPLGAMPRYEGDSQMSSTPRLAVGGSFFYNLAPTDIGSRLGVTDTTRLASLRDQDTDGEVDNISIYSAAAELAFYWRGVSLSGELFYRKEDPGAVSGSRSFWGTNAQLAAAHAAGLELAVRYSFWERNRFGEDGLTMAPARSHEATLALSAWLFNRAVRVLTSYSHRWLRDISDRQGNTATEPNLRAHLVVVQTQLMF
jgi:hypothetical protein